MKVVPKQSSLDLNQLELGLRATTDGMSKGKVSNSGDSAFFDMLKNSVTQVNSEMKAGDKASVDLATGKTSNIHETMLAVTKAELGFNMLVQLRNKAIEAYQEVMRMQV